VIHPFTEISRFLSAIRLLIFNKIRKPSRASAELSLAAVCYLDRQMRKPDIAKQLARRSRLSQGEAADRLDVILQKIVSDLRKGREPALPGLGRFKHGPDGLLAFEPEVRRRHD
jgi:Bacterial DNA-binding protein